MHVYDKLGSTLNEYRTRNMLTTEPTYMELETNW